MPASLTFEEVRDLWIRAGAKNTLGILHWFEPLIPTWNLTTIAAVDVDDLLLIGGVDGEGWDAVTSGTYRVADAVDEAVAPIAAWDPEWALVAVRNPENGHAVLIDGVNRAIGTSAGVDAGVLDSATPIQIVLGDLHSGGWVLAVAKAIAPGWRE